jgi:acetyltransferase
VEHRHSLAQLFDPAAALLIVEHGSPSRDLPWVAAVRREFLAPAERPGVSRRILSLHGEVAQPPGGSAAAANAAGLAVVATPIDSALAALELAAANGARAAVVLDRSSDEALVQATAARGRALRLRLLGPGSMGLQRPALGLNGGRLGRLPAPGNVALVSQSGVLGSAILDWAGDTAIGFSLVVSLGAELDVDLAQVLDYLADDRRTKAVVVYLEAVQASRGFMSALRALASVKPVVVLKAGRDATMRSAARTHSGALGRADAVYSAALRRAGAVQVRLFTQLFTAVRYLAARNWPLGKRLAIVSNGQGPAMLAADQAWMQGIRLLPFGASTVAALRRHDPSLEAVNPLNLRIDAGPEDYAAAIEALARDPDSDAVLVLLAPGAGVDAERITERIVDLSRSFPKPLFACWLGDSSVRALRTKLDTAGLPVYRTPEAAVDAFSTVGTFYQNQLLLQQMPRPLSEAAEPDLEGARSIVADALAEGREVLTETESKAVLGAFGIPITPTVLARSEREAIVAAEQIGFPVVMKIASTGVTHKSDVGGVALNVRNGAEVRAQFAAIVSSVRAAMPEAPIAGVTLQRMVGSDGGRELYVGVFRNKLFGPVIAFGSGGTRVELTGDTTLEFPPLNGFLARSMIGRTRVAATLGAFRGMPAIDEEALVRVLVRVSEMVSELPQLAEMDINPLIVAVDGTIAVDARIVLDPTPSREGGRYGHMAIMPYPAHLERDAALRDGREYLMRPIQAEDADALQRFVRGLSQESRYFRFISTLNELTPRMLVRYTQIDYDRELALVAVRREQAPGAVEEIIGVARYLLNPDRDTCEFAIAIGDAFQGQGLGSKLMRALIAVARKRGLKRMEGFVLAINAPMIRLMRSLGFTISRDPDDETMKLVWLALDSPEETTQGRPGAAFRGGRVPGSRVEQ